MKFRDRNCSNPEPQYGGELCFGNETNLEACNEEPCPSKKPILIMFPDLEHYCISLKDLCYNYDPPSLERIRKVQTT